MSTTHDKQRKSITDFLVHGLANSTAVVEPAVEAVTPKTTTDNHHPIQRTKPTKNTLPNVRPKLKPGRPRSVATERVHVALTPDMYSYLEDAWRTHRTLDGGRAKGPSAFIEDLLARHSQQNRK